MGKGAMMGMEEKNKLLQMIEELPFWAQSVLSIIAVVIVAAIAGMIIGKLYAMVKYPDPETRDTLKRQASVSVWAVFSTVSLIRYLCSC